MTDLRPPGPGSPARPDGRPLLGEGQIGVLRRYGPEQAVGEGEVLFADGDQSYDLIVLLEGQVDIVQGYGRPDPVLIARYGPSEFLGEMGLLTGQRVYLTAEAAAPSRVLRIPVDGVRSIMAQELDLSELILRSFLYRHARLTSRGTGLTLIGSRFDGNTRRLLEVLARNRLPSRWLELEESAEAEMLLRELQVPPADLPIVVVPGSPLLRNPGNRELLAALGLVAIHEDANDPTEICDLLVVGGGPAGLAAAVYGASEGMTTTLAEDTALGGQAGTSSRIENYLGFPAGLSGEELAVRGSLQAQKFGVRIKLAARAVGLSTWNGAHHVRFEDGETVSALSVIIATGARYNRLPLARLADFEGVGVYYAATQMEAQTCAGRPAVVVGGGNSAGQAALFLARTCSRVHLVIRGDDLANSMSRYLIDQIDRHPEISLSTRTEVVGLVGETVLQGVELRDGTDRSTSVLEVCGLFVFIGAKPSTDWLEGQLATDDHGFLLTGTDLPADVRDGLDQPPLLLETCRPGVFGVGDVRSGSVKRAATAIGEGSMAVRLVFDRLQATGLAVAAPPSPGAVR
ncbi:MAG TPA: FAD-dependent oxidoreductase [Acidimicrobiales bacterium]|nr:FAD-dependent oxidoreductase [Acidimicrobiales bacterium]